MTKDGSSVEKIIDGGSQAAPVKYLDKYRLKKLINNGSKDK